MRAMRDCPYEWAEPHIKNITNVVCSVTKVPIEKILSRRGNVEVREARSIICYISVMNRYGMVNTGKALNGREHSTIRFNKIAFEGHIKYDEELQHTYQQVLNQLPMSPYVMPGIKKELTPGQSTSIEDKIERIIYKVCEYFDIDKSIFRKKTTDRKVIRMRNVLWAVLKYQLPKIGDRRVIEFTTDYNYSHCSVIQGVYKVKDDKDLKEINAKYFCDEKECE